MLKPLILMSLMGLPVTLMAKESPQRTALNKLLGQSKDKFKVAGCEKFQLNPAELFKAVVYKTGFNKNCDIQGEVALKLFLPFPLDFQVKNLFDYKRLKGTAKLNLGMENPPKILGELTNAQLQGKDTIYFNAYYSGEVMPATTLKVKPGTESVRVQIMNKTFDKKLEEFTVKVE